MLKISKDNSEVLETTAPYFLFQFKFFIMLQTWNIRVFSGIFEALGKNCQWLEDECGTKKSWAEVSLGMFRGLQNSFFCETVKDFYSLNFMQNKYQKGRIGGFLKT